MDRLPLVIIVLALAGCNDRPSSPAAPRSRVDAVKATGGKRATSADFCDVLPAPDQAPVFAFPPLTASAPATTGWRWVNIWATWCQPCIEELPLLAKWRASLAKAGHPVELVFVSVDDSDEALVRYKKEHADAPSSVRVTDAQRVMPAWLRGVGLDENAPIPIHVLVDASNRVRCTRAGALRDADYPVVEELFAGAPGPK
jgi:thiol-disulfide isomerase/thioredoxin